MDYAYIAISIWSALIVFYTLYLAAINFYEHWRDTSRLVVVIASPVLLTMIVCDVVMQMTLFTLIFLDIPRDFLVTQRLIRYRAQETGWRKHWADEICTRALNPFDPSKHHC
jgi:hypothetical protein